MYQHTSYLVTIYNIYIKSYNPKKQPLTNPSTTHYDDVFYWCYCIVLSKDFRQKETSSVFILEI